MPTQALFPTLIYHEPLLKSGLEKFNAELADDCRRIRDYDAAGRRWSGKNYPGGYTSYASLNQLHKISSTFSGLERRITTHVRRYAKALDLDLRGKQIHMSDFWVNIMPEHVAHGLHLHPLSFISGTYYVVTPPGCAGLKFEDPRLDRFMAAPPKIPDASPSNRTHLTHPAKAGHVVLFESWLRHEVPANRTAAERISVSFNYSWS